MVQLLQKTVWRFLKKLNIEPPYGLAIPLLHIFPKELKTGTPTNTCTHLFTAAMNRAQQLADGNNTTVRQ